jgi:glycosyltransferase involved in cell wall biosynthesis
VGDLVGCDLEHGGTKTKLLGVPKANGNNCMFAIYDLIESEKPDVVLTIGDYFDFWYMKAVKEKLDYSFKWVPYLTVEHHEFDKRSEVYSVADEIIVPSQYGKRIVKERWGVDAHVIPYGIDPRFKPPAQRSLDGPTKFLCVGQNTWRKMLPVMIQAFSKAEAKCDCELYLHTNIHATDPLESSLFDLKSIVAKLGAKNIRFPGDDKYFCIFDSPGDDYMAQAYSQADFLVSSSVCEGYGLPVVEAMACGVPLVGSGTSTLYEHVGLEFGRHGLGDRGYLSKPRLEICPPDRMTSFPDPNHLSEAMLAMDCMRRQRPGSVEGMRKGCLEYARGLAWDETGRRIEAILQETSKAPVTIPVENVV